jgi:hypothetical protein
MYDWIADNLLGRALRQRRAEIVARAPLFLAYDYHLRYQLIPITGPHPARWQPGLLTVEPDGIHLYPRTAKMDVHVHFPALHWFGRPQKYRPGDNELWLHSASGSGWYLLKLRLSQHYTRLLVRALKQIATPEQITAYRRQRPYIHYGPAPAAPAVQSIHGAWDVAARPSQLYVMPAALVLFDAAGQVERALPLEQIQGIEVMRRLDAPEQGGVVRFRVTGPSPQTLAFALPDYGPLGAALAEAARRSLEQPPIFYGKKKDDENDEPD